MGDPLPPALPDDPLTAFFWKAALAGELHIQRCADCGTYVHPPRPVCRSCRSFELAGEQVSGAATLYSYSITHRPFHPYYAERVPYPVAVVELVEQAGLRLLSRLVELEEPEIEIGMDLEVRFERLAPDLALPVFGVAR